MIVADFLEGVGGQAAVFGQFDGILEGNDTVGFGVQDNRVGFGLCESREKRHFLIIYFTFSE